MIDIIHNSLYSAYSKPWSGGPFLCNVVSEANEGETCKLPNLLFQASISTSNDNINLSILLRDRIVCSKDGNSIGKLPLLTWKQKSFIFLVDARVLRRSHRLKVPGVVHAEALNHAIRYCYTEHMILHIKFQE